MVLSLDTPSSITRIWSRALPNSVSVSGGTSSLARLDSSEVANSSGTRRKTSRILYCVSSPVYVKKKLTIGSWPMTGCRAISVRKRSNERRRSSRNCWSADEKKTSLLDVFDNVFYRKFRTIIYNWAIVKDSKYLCCLFINNIFLIPCFRNYALLYQLQYKLLKLFKDSKT